MDIISVLLTGVGLAMDAFSVAVTDGITLKKPKLSGVIKIALFFGAFQFLMPCLGFFCCSAFSKLVEAFAPWIAFVLLAFIGGKMIFEAVCEKEECEEIKNPLSFATLTVLAIATSIDALAVGVVFATELMTLPVVLLSAGLIGIVTFIISFAGVYIGAKCGNLLGNKAEIAGGLVLVGIGIKILLEYLLF